MKGNIVAPNAELRLEFTKEPENIEVYTYENNESFVIVTIVKGINVLCKTGVEAIKAAEERLEELQNIEKVYGQ